MLPPINLQRDKTGKETVKMTSQIRELPLENIKEDLHVTISDSGYYGCSTCHSNTYISNDLLLKTSYDDARTNGFIYVDETTSKNSRSIGTVNDLLLKAIYPDDQNNTNSSSFYNDKQMYNYTNNQEEPIDSFLTLYSVDQDSSPQNSPTGEHVSKSNDIKHSNVDSILNVLISEEDSEGSEYDDSISSEGSISPVNELPLLYEFKRTIQQPNRQSSTESSDDNNHDIRDDIRDYGKRRKKKVQKSNMNLVVKSNSKMLPYNTKKMIGGCEKFINMAQCIDKLDLPKEDTSSNHILYLQQRLFKPFDENCSNSSSGNLNCMLIKSKKSHNQINDERYISTVKKPIYAGICSYEYDRAPSNQRLLLSGFGKGSIINTRSYSNAFMWGAINMIMIILNSINANINIVNVINNNIPLGDTFYRNTFIWNFINTIVTILNSINTNMHTWSRINIKMITWPYIIQYDSQENALKGKTRDSLGIVISKNMSPLNGIKIPILHMRSVTLPQNIVGCNSHEIISNNDMIICDIGNKKSTLENNLLAIHTINCSSDNGNNAEISIGRNFSKSSKPIYQCKMVHKTNCNIILRRKVSLIPKNDSKVKFSTHCIIAIRASKRTKKSANVPEIGSFIFKGQFSDVKFDRSSINLIESFKQFFSQDIVLQVLERNPHSPKSFGENSLNGSMIRALFLIDSERANQEMNTKQSYISHLIFTSNIKNLTQKNIDKLQMCNSYKFPLIDRSMQIVYEVLAPPTHNDIKIETATARMKLMNVNSIKSICKSNLNGCNFNIRRNEIMIKVGVNSSDTKKSMNLSNTRSMNLANSKRNAFNLDTMKNNDYNYIQNIAIAKIVINERFHEFIKQNVDLIISASNGKERSLPIVNIDNCLLLNCSDNKIISRRAVPGKTQTGDARKKAIHRSLRINGDLWCSSIALSKNEYSVLKGNRIVVQEWNGSKFLCRLSRDDGDLYPQSITNCSSRITSMESTKHVDNHYLKNFDLSSLSTRLNSNASYLLTSKLAVTDYKTIVDMKEKLIIDRNILPVNKMGGQIYMKNVNKDESRLICTESVGKIHGFDNKHLYFTKLANKEMDSCKHYRGKVLSRKSECNLSFLQKNVAESKTATAKRHINPSIWYDHYEESSNSKLSFLSNLPDFWICLGILLKYLCAAKDLKHIDLQTIVYEALQKKGHGIFLVASRLSYDLITQVTKMVHQNTGAGLVFDSNQTSKGKLFKNYLKNLLMFFLQQREECMKVSRKGEILKNGLAFTSGIRNGIDLDLFIEESQCLEQEQCTGKDYSWKIPYKRDGLYADEKFPWLKKDSVLTRLRNIEFPLNYYSHKRNIVGKGKGKKRRSSFDSKVSKYRKLNNLQGVQSFPVATDINSLSENYEMNLFTEPCSTIKCTKCLNVAHTEDCQWKHLFRFERLPLYFIPASTCDYICEACTPLLDFKRTDSDEILSTYDIIDDVEPITEVPNLIVKFEEKIENLDSDDYWNEKDAIKTPSLTHIFEIVAKESKRIHMRENIDALRSIDLTSRKNYNLIKISSKEIQYFSDLLYKNDSGEKVVDEYNNDKNIANKVLEPSGNPNSILYLTNGKEERDTIDVERKEKKESIQLDELNNATTKIEDLGPDLVGDNLVDIHANDFKQVVDEKDNQKEDSNQETTCIVAHSVKDVDELNQDSSQNVVYYMENSGYDEYHSESKASCDFQSRDEGEISSQNTECCSSHNVFNEEDLNENTTDRLEDISKDKTSDSLIHSALICEEEGEINGFVSNDVIHADELHQFCYDSCDEEHIDNSIKYTTHYIEGDDQHTGRALSSNEDREDELCKNYTDPITYKDSENHDLNNYGVERESVTQSTNYFLHLHLQEDKTETKMAPTTSCKENNVSNFKASVNVSPNENEIHNSSQNTISDHINGDRIISSSDNTAFNAYYFRYKAVQSNPNIFNDTLNQNNKKTDSNLDTSHSVSNDKVKKISPSQTSNDSFYHKKQQDSKNTTCKTKNKDKSSTADKKNNEQKQKTPVNKDKIIQLNETTKQKMDYLYELSNDIIDRFTSRTKLNLTIPDLKLKESAPTLQKINEEFLDTEKSIVDRLSKCQKEIISILIAHSTNANDESIAVAGNAVKLLTSMIDKKTNIVGNLVKQNNDLVTEIKLKREKLNEIKSKLGRNFNFLQSCMKNTDVIHDLDPNLFGNKKKDITKMNNLLTKTTIEEEEDDGNYLKSFCTRTIATFGYIFVQYRSSLLMYIKDNEIKSSQVIEKMDFETLKYHLSILELQISKKSIEKQTVVLDSNISLVHTLSRCQKQMVTILSSNNNINSPTGRRHLPLDQTDRNYAKKLLFSLVDKKYEIIDTLTKKNNELSEFLTRQSDLLSQLEVEVTNSKELCTLSTTTFEESRPKIRKKLFSYTYNHEESLISGKCSVEKQAQTIADDMSIDFVVTRQSPPTDNHHSQLSKREGCKTNIVSDTILRNRNFNKSADKLAQVTFKMHRKCHNLNGKSKLKELLQQTECKDCQTDTSIASPALVSNLKHEKTNSKPVLQRRRTLSSESKFSNCDLSVIEERLCKFQKDMVRIISKKRKEALMT